MRTIRLAALVVALSACSGTLWAVPAVASTAEPVVVVLDRSGSMGEDDGTGRIKLEGARVAVMDLARSLPAGTRIGLRTYPGEDRCGPGQARLSGRGGVAPVDMSAVAAHVRSVTADGNTPTAPALAAAGEDLRASGSRSGTIVLVSDGESTCGGDPCETAASLASTGIDVTVNTVGFRISQRGREELECVADATDGQYVDVENSSELADALESINDVRLTTRLDHPDEVDLVTADRSGGDVTVTAEVSNRGAVRVQSVVVAIQFGVDFAPTVLDPRRSLGALDPGESVQATWRFRVPLEFEDRSVTFDVTTTSSAGTRSEQSGRIELRSGLTEEMVGPVLAGRRVAILGDSYSSGEGAGDYDPATDTLANSCHRSSRTYLAEVVEDLTVQACSGAVTSDLTWTSDDGHPSQLSQLDPEATDAVVLTTGGNDVGFASTIINCAVLEDCTEEDFRDAFVETVCGPVLGTPCREVRQSTPEERLMGRIEGTYQQLVTAYRRIDDRLNRSDVVAARGGTIAPVLVLSYVNTTPANAASRGRCSAAFTAGELGLIQRGTAALNAVIARAVADVAAEGRPVFHVPDTEQAMQPDHTYCDEEPFVNGLSPGDTVLYYGRDAFQISTTGGVQARVSDSRLLRYQEQMHPTADGYRAITAAILRWSTSEAAPDGVERGDVPDALRVEPIDPAAVLDLDVDPLPPIQGGTPIRVQGGSFLPGSTAEISIQSDEHVLARTTVPDDGSLDVVVEIPDIEPGEHTLLVRGVDADGLPLLRVRATTVVRPQSPAITSLGIASGLIGMLAAASMVLVAHRRPVDAD